MNVAIQSQRQSLSLEVAAFFETHLRAELAKREELRNQITYEGMSFAEFTAAMLEELLSEFPELKSRRSGPVLNVFERWWTSMNQPVAYLDATFKSYNVGFMARVLDLKHGTRRSKYKMASVYREILRRASAKSSSTFNFQSIYAGESRLTEYLRRSLT